MKKYVFFLLKWILIFLVGSILIFGVVRLMPTSPVDHYLTKMSLPLTEENRAVIRKNMGLDKPVVQQYFDWIFDFLRGNWGVSLTSHTDIRTEFLAVFFWDWYRWHPDRCGICLAARLSGSLSAKRLL